MVKEFENDFYNKFVFGGAKVNYFESEQVRGFFEVIAKLIVQKLKPKSVLDVGCACGYLVDSLRRCGVLAFGIDVSTVALEKVSDKAKDFCFRSSIFQELPSKLPKKFDLVVCNGVLNWVCAHEVKYVIDKLAAVADTVLLGFYCGSKGLSKVDFSHIACVFAQNEFFKNDFFFFKNEVCKISLFSKQIESFSAVQAYENELHRLKRELFFAQKSSEQLQQKLLAYSRNFVNLRVIGQRYVDLKQEHSNTLIELNVLRSSFERYSAIVNSSFWKLTKPMRVCVDFLKINVVGFFKSVCLFLAGKNKKNGIEQIKQLYAQNPYGAYFKLTRVSEKVLNQQRLVKFKKNYVVSVVVPIYNSSCEFLQQLIDSLRLQTYKFWQLCLADGSDAFHFKERALCERCAKQDPRIKYLKLEKNLGISQNTNEALKMATGNYIALLDHDDLLSPDALFECMKAVEKQGADFVYTDEMNFENEVENVKFIHFKPDFSPDTLRSNNYICHLSLFSSSLLKQVGGFSSAYDGSQDYDIILRLTEKAKKVVHVPKVLYYWRVHSMSVSQDLINKPYCLDSAKKALKAHLKRVGLNGKVSDSRYPSTYSVEYGLQARPKLSIVILNCNEVVWLKICIDSILAASTYDNYEILIVENSSNEQTLDFYKVLQSLSSKIRVVVYEQTGAGFNYSALVNFGISNALGDYFVLLHNDVKILTKNWLEQLLMFVQRNEVGAAGVKLLYDDDTVQGGGYFLSKNNVAMNAYRMLSKNEGGYVCRACLVQNLSAVSSACLCTKRSVWNEVGGFDENLTFNFCDVDYCLRLRDRNYLIVFNANVEILHNETSNRKRGRQESPEGLVQFENERSYMLSKWSDVLKAGDPYYNVNFNDDVCNFSLRKDKAGSN